MGCPWENALLLISSAMGVASVLGSGVDSGLLAGVEHAAHRAAVAAIALASRVQLRPRIMISVYSGGVKIQGSP
jgi:hypothetical protein